MLLGILSCCCAYADIGQVENGSFEIDGPMADLANQDPNGWTVDLAVPQFGGAVDAAWSTDGRFSLVLFVQWYTPLRAGDRAAVSQPIDLMDVNEIAFDAKLDTYWGSRWDPNQCSAVVMIDQDVVWDANGLAGDVIGTRLQGAYRVEDKYRDGRPHDLALVLKINADSLQGLSDFYRVRWDNVRCTPAVCGGGPLPGDFNRDCFLDVDDLMMMAAAWLNRVDLSNPYNLSGIDDEESAGIVNFFDVAVFADDWRSSRLVQGE
jgi:hypothetical protein